MSRFAFVGSFTTAARKARGAGIGLWRIADDGWHLAGQIAQTNPSFLIAEGGVLYAAHGDSDYASAWRIGDGGALTPLGRAATGGHNSVHLALMDGHLIVANYASGSLAVLPVRADGGLADAVQVLTLSGEHGPDPVEQAGSHPHQVVIDGRFLLVPDKGLDRVFTLTFENGHLIRAGETTFRPGAGPRHLALMPGFAFVVGELNSTLTACHWDQGVLTPFQTLSTLPPEFTGANTAAAIVVAGPHMYVSNRGQDGIAHFRFDNECLHFRDCTPAGRDPRFICLAPDGALLVANEQGDTITRFTIDAASGALAHGEILLHSTSPTTIAFDERLPISFQP